MEIWFNETFQICQATFLTTKKRNEIKLDIPKINQNI